MLNELREVGRALADAGITASERHPDVKEVNARKGALRVQLDAEGAVRRIAPLSPDEAANLWTLRDGQHNSFPYHQIKDPLLRVDPDDPRLETVRNKRGDEGERWSALLDLAEEAAFDDEAFADWPGDGYLKRLGERRMQLAPLCDTDAAAIPVVLDRFRLGAERPHDLLRGIAGALVEDVRRGRISTDLPLVASLLVDGGGPLFFDVTRDFPRQTIDPANVDDVSRVLVAETTGEPNGVCAVAGTDAFLIADKFPQPNLPILGQTYLFARNKDAPTNARYGRTGTDSVAVGSDTAAALAAAAERLTRDDWKGRTWRGVPGERPKQTDLFIAFIPGAKDVPVAALLSEDPPAPGTERRFATLAEQLTAAFDGWVRERKKTRLSLFVLRKLDPANRKAVYSASLDVDALLDAARRWSRACGNVPPPIRLPVPAERGKPPARLPPRHLAPFSLPRITRQHFIRGGTQRQEIVGLTYDEAMRLFLAPDEAVAASARAVLRRVLRSRGTLLEGVGHAQARGFDDLKAFDRQEALDTVTLLGLLLRKLGRPREEYMEEVAYKLGRLLAAADALHAGYNASERGGSALPPRLIGNAALPLAQSDPARALDVLGRRWTVYAGWAKRNAGFRVPEPTENGGGNDEKARQATARAWQIRNGISAAYRVKALAKELHGKLPPRGDVKERFRAELLLGYMAGPPRADEARTEDDNDNTERGDE